MKGTVKETIKCLPFETEETRRRNQTKTLLNGKVEPKYQLTKLISARDLLEISVSFNLSRDLSQTGEKRLALLADFSRFSPLFCTEYS